MPAPDRDALVEAVEALENATKALPVMACVLDTCDLAGAEIARAMSKRASSAAAALMALKSERVWFCQVTGRMYDSARFDCEDHAKDKRNNCGWRTILGGR